MTSLNQAAESLAESHLAKYLPMIYKAMDSAEIIYSEDQLEHCAEDNFMAGFFHGVRHILGREEIVGIKQALQSLDMRTHTSGHCTACTALAALEKMMAEAEGK